MYQTQLWLLEATQDNTSSMLTQIEELKSFLVEVATLNGKGPSYMTCDRADRNTQICATKSYAVEYTNMYARQEMKKTTICRYLCQAVV